MSLFRYSDLHSIKSILMEAIKNQFPHSQKEGGTILNLLVATETILDKYNVPWTVRPRSNYKPCSIEFSATFVKISLCGFNPMMAIRSWTWIRMINPRTDGSQITPCSAAAEIHFYGTCCLCQNVSFAHQATLWRQVAF